MAQHFSVHYSTVASCKLRFANCLCYKIGSSYWELLLN